MAKIGEIAVTFCKLKKKNSYVSEGPVDFSGPPFVPETDGVDEPKQIVPFRPGHRLLPQQLEDGRAHRRPFVLKGQLTLVLQHFKVTEFRIEGRLAEKRDWFSRSQVFKDQ